MRRLAGPLIFFVGALIVIYSVPLMLLSLNTKAHESQKTRKNVLSEKIVVSPTHTSTPSPKPTLTPIPTPESTPTETLVKKEQKTQTISHKDYILGKINEYRASQGVLAASSNSETCSFAKQRAGEIAFNFNHDGFAQRINSNSLSYPSYSMITENIAMTQNYQDVVDIWIKSPPHAENMRKDTPYICVEQSGNYFAYEGWKP